MTIRYLKKYAALEDVVTVEEAESLWEWMCQQAHPAVNLSKCQHLHTAVLQVLLAARPKFVGEIGDSVLAMALGQAHADSAGHESMTKKGVTL